MAYANEIFTYSPEFVSVLIGGYTVSGLLKVVIEKESPTFKVIRGIRGRNTRVRNKDESYTITLDLQQTDPVNDFLSDMHITDKRGEGGTFEIIIYEAMGNTAFSAQSAFVETMPRIEFANDFTDRTWVIKTLSNDGVFLGGNDVRTRSSRLLEVGTPSR